ncbi:MAG: hypothetical protein HUU34_10775 [Saprospiraceae bacterium]|nr:hypothetical protein [Saprospiraceae bacterium]
MDKQLTVAIDEPEKIRKRLLGQDSIGIVPEYLSLCCLSGKAYLCI